MKWIQLAYCILVVNAVVAAIMAIVIRLTTRTGTEVKTIPAASGGSFPGRGGGAIFTLRWGCD